MEVNSYNNAIWPIDSIISDDSQPSETGSKTAVGKDEFLQLLIAQLKNQDPLDPIKNENFLAQLATFSSLEQLIDIKTAVNLLAGIETDGETGGMTNNP